MIDEIARLPNVHVICSCREFEFSYDGRLAGLDADAIHLELPKWQDVDTVLTDRGIHTDQWPEDARDLLRIPQHLKVFLQLNATDDECPRFTSWQAMLEELWKQKVQGDGVDADAVQLLKEVASEIADREELSIPTVRFTDRFGTKLVDQMVAAGILKMVNRRLRIEFSHQTLYEHARARMFLTGSESLVDYVFRHQDSLFVRPTIWTSLNLLRESDPAEYSAVMTQLCGGGSWRAHVLFLLIDFLGELQKPSDDEERWLCAFLRNPETRRRAIRAITGQRAWFNRLQVVVFPALMADDELNWWMIYVINEAWQFDHDRCLKLLEENWLPHPSRDEFSMHAFEKLQNWTTEIVEMICTMIRRSNVAAWLPRSIAKNLRESHPDFSARLIAELLRKRIESASADDPNDRFQFSKQENDWYGADEIAAAAPQAFLGQVFPLVLQVEQQSHRTENRYRNEYRRSYELDLRLDWVLLPDNGISEHGIIAAVVAAVRTLAETNAAQYVRFARNYGRRNSRFVQMLLTDGWMFAALQRPAECLEFLLADDRRLALGEIEDEHAVSRRTIEALVPRLRRDQFRRLERGILTFSGYRQGVQETEPDVWPIREEHERTGRLELLDGLPDARLLQSTRRLIERESAELRPSGSPVRSGQSFRRVESPMSAAQMAEATDEEILALFNVLTDDVEHHPDDWMLGGSEEASREFEQFARSAPDRAIRIARSFRPTGQTRPAAHLIYALVEVGRPATGILQLVTDFDVGGFTNYDFRETCCLALRNLAARNNGLPDSACEMLTRWLDDWPISERDEQFPDDVPEDGESVLFSSGQMVTLPHGTYSCLNSLRNALLDRRRPARSRWLAVLEKHLTRGDTPRTWWMLALDFARTSRSPVARVSRFATNLFSTYPDISNTRLGISALWTFWDFLDEHVRRDILGKLRSDEEGCGRQSYGELVAARYFFRSDDAWATDEMNLLLRNPAIPERLGLAWVVSRAWKHRACRENASHAFEQIAATATSEEAKALMHVAFYENSFPADQATVRVLNAVLSSPALLAVDTHGWLAKRLVRLLNIETELICSIAEQLVAAGSMDSRRTDLSMCEDELIDISLRLQRAGGQWRVRGLNLFESILGLGLPKAERVLADSDRRIR